MILLNEAMKAFVVVSESAGGYIMGSPITPTYIKTSTKTKAQLLKEGFADVTIKEGAK